MGIAKKVRFMAQVYEKSAYLCENFCKMKIKCDYCGAVIDETEPRCPSCGAPLSGANRTSNEEPKTIEELKAWYVAHHLPPENITRFFIGKDINEPKAFGIYKNSVGDFVVYKNKSTGERAIRYQGADEAYAVNELYQRLKAEIVDQKAYLKTRTSGSTARPAAAPVSKKKKGCLIAILIFIAIGIIGAIFDDTPPNGYYNYKGTEYYHQGSSWYYYDDEADDWFKATNIDEITDDNADDYRIYHHTGKDFESSTWYDNGSTNNDRDWDDDHDWGSSSSSDWSSSSTDWDSDW